MTIDYIALHGIISDISPEFDVTRRIFMVKARILFGRIYSISKLSTQARKGIHGNHRKRWGIHMRTLSALEGGSVFSVFVVAPSEA
jgi:hypothetical protein